VDIPALHRRKTHLYNDRIRSGDITLRPGVERLIRKARAHRLPLAIATTTSRPNVISLIAATLGESAVSWFASIRTGEDVARKKPDPEVFNLVLADLGLAAADCVAFEDSANGLKAALAAGIPTIVTPSLYTEAEAFSAAALVLRDLNELPLSAAMHRRQRIGPLPITPVVHVPAGWKGVRWLDGNARELPAASASARQGFSLRGNPATTNSTSPTLAATA
jgi:HAD superfamily hydrolase (TIGR01509 family)